jgi:hypothetical protein
MDWPVFAVITVLFALVALGIGIWRKDPPLIIAMSTGGGVTYILALRWAIELGEQAVLAAFIASGGCILFTMAAERSRAAKGKATVGR